MRQHKDCICCHRFPVSQSHWLNISSCERLGVIIYPVFFNSILNVWSKDWPDYSQEFSLSQVDKFLLVFHWWMSDFTFVASELQNWNLKDGTKTCKNMNHNQKACLIKIQEASHLHATFPGTHVQSASSEPSPQSSRPLHFQSSCMHTPLPHCWLVGHSEMK